MNKICQFYRDNKAENTSNTPYCMRAGCKADATTHTIQTQSKPTTPKQSPRPPKTIPDDPGQAETEMAAGTRRIGIETKTRATCKESGEAPTADPPA
ncbi:hypothetical protein N7492_002710 [Penicillium capsulatum]|uniref:Uncharacterized protein n=1 Tax=Penicillium capsulatum TaxID=69766 RepID=A0A9W9LVY1_9EURO|nr:hypothetical protein N7492_002710 [Penicillium capsulatum]KAJ6122694.1 hypothetical protein N7512_005159 [Penicillium capsulatum]